MQIVTSLLTSSLAQLQMQTHLSPAPFLLLLCAHFVRRVTRVIKDLAVQAAASSSDGCRYSKLCAATPSLFPNLTSTTQSKSDSPIMSEASIPLFSQTTVEMLSTYGCHGDLFVCLLTFNLPRLCDGILRVAMRISGDNHKHH